MYKINDMIIMQTDLLNWLKKIQKLLFQEIPKKFIKNNFELMISIYFHQMIWFNLISIQFSKKWFTLILSKEFITKFQFGNKNDSYLLLPKKEWYFNSILFLKEVSFTILFTKILKSNSILFFKDDF